MPATIGLLMSGTGAVGGLFGGLYNGILGNQRYNWSQGLIDQGLQQAQGAQNSGTNLFYLLNEPNAQNAIQQLSNLYGNMWGTQDSPGYLPNLQNQISKTPYNLQQLFQGNTQYQTPTSVNAQQNAQSLQNRQNDIQNTSQQLFNGGGWTPQYQQQFDNLNGLLSQVNLNGLGNTANATAQNFIQNNGNNALTQNFQDQAMNAIGNNGFTPTLDIAGAPLQSILSSMGQNGVTNSLANVGNSVLGANGLTPTGQMGENVALQGLSTQGATPGSNALQQLGLGFAANNQLMSPLAAASFAGDQSRATSQKLAEQQIENALARGGGPGSNVANGMQNANLASYADQINSARATAMENALINQQGLGLQQQQLGSSMAQGGLNAQQSFLNTYGNQLSNLENVASGRFGTAANMLQGSGSLQNQALLGGLSDVNALQNAATGNMSAIGQLGLSAGNLANSNLNSGLGVLNTMGNLNLGGMNAYNSTMGNQNQYAMGAGNLFNQSGSIQNSLLGNLFNNEIQGGQLALNQNNALSNVWNNSTQNQLGLLNSYNTLMNNNSNTLTGSSGQAMNLWQTALGMYPALANASMAPVSQNPYGSLASAGASIAGKH